MNQAQKQPSILYFTSLGDTWYYTGSSKRPFTRNKQAAKKYWDNASLASDSYSLKKNRGINNLEIE